MRTWKLKTAAASGFYEGPSVQQFGQGAREFSTLQRFGQYSRHTGSNRPLRQHGTTELGNHAVYHCQPQTGAIICAILSMAALALLVG